MLALALLIQSSGPKLSAEDLKADVAIMRSALEEAHPGIYRYTPKAEMDRAFDALTASLTEPITALDLYKRTCPVVAKIKCGHTGVLLPPDIRKSLLSDNLFPAELKLIKGNLYIREGLTPESSPYTGWRIDRINGKSSAEVVKTLLRARSGDGDGTTGKAYYLCAGFRANLLLDAFFNFKAPFGLDLSKGGKTDKVEFKTGLTDEQLRAEHRKRHPDEDGMPPFNLTFPKEGTALLRISSFAGTDTPQEYTTFFDKAFKDIGDNGCRNLIVDVRGNGGGYDSAGKDLVVHLVERPFEYYRDLLINKREFSFKQYATDLQPIPETMATPNGKGTYVASGHPNWGTQHPRDPVFTGKVIALIDGGSFSTTGECMSVLKGLNRATFVGEETGAGITGNNSGPNATVTLPHSKLGVLVQFLRYEVSCGKPKLPRRGIMPDIEIVPTIEDVIVGRDPVMEKALTLSK